MPLNLAEIIAAKKAKKETACDPLILLELAYKGRIFSGQDPVGALKLLADWLDPDPVKLSEVLEPVPKEALAFRDWKILSLAMHSGLKEAQVLSWFIRRVLK